MKAKYLKIFSLLLFVAFCSPQAEKENPLLKALLLLELTKSSSTGKCPGSDKIAVRIRNNHSQTHTYKVFASSNGSCSGAQLLEYSVAGNNAISSYQCAAQAQADANMDGSNCSAISSLSLGKRYLADTNPASGLIFTFIEE